MEVVNQGSNQSSSNESSSLASVNNDWFNWVVFHGSKEVAVEDIWGIGKAIGITFKGENHNMFQCFVSN